MWSLIYSLWFVLIKYEYVDRLCSYWKTDKFISTCTLTFNNFSPAFLIMYGKVLLNSLRTCLLMSEIVTKHTFIFHQINIQIFIQYCIKKNPMTKQSRHLFLHMYIKLTKKKYCIILLCHNDLLYIWFVP